MNTQQLESFVQVAENLSFTRAAEILNSTTATISRQISSLEEELDTKLLQRTTKSVSLTPAGISFFNDAKEILAKLKLASKKIKNHTDANIQILSIGCVTEAELSYVIKLLQQCREKLPEIHPFLRIIPSRLIYNMLIHDEIDILINFKDNIPMREPLLYHEIMQIPIGCVLPVTHHLAEKKILSLKDIEKEHIVICNSYEIPLQVANIQNVLSHQVLPNAIYYSDNLQAMITLIKSGYGIGILPEIKTNDPSLTFIPIDIGRSLSYGFFYKDNVQNPSLRKFLSLLKTK